MARGWESKSVESQIESLEERLARKTAIARTAQQVAHERERDGLLLSRERVAADLASAANPNYRKQLERSLAFLDEKLQALSERQPNANVSTPDRRE